MKIDHINITVPNITEAIDYYTQTLGFQLKEKFEGNGMTFVFLTDGTLTYEILEDSYVTEAFIDHIAYVSEDIQADFDKYNAQGLTTTSISYLDFLFDNGVYFFFIKGACNEKIEFLQRKKVDK